jgi:hypothetical protein
VENPLELSAQMTVLRRKSIVDTDLNRRVKGPYLLHKQGVNIPVNSRKRCPYLIRKGTRKRAVYQNDGHFTKAYLVVYTLFRDQRKFNLGTIYDDLRATKYCICIVVVENLCMVSVNELVV